VPSATKQRSTDHARGTARPDGVSAEISRDAVELIANRAEISDDAATLKAQAAAPTGDSAPLKDANG
jgi:hypothetical protein